MRRQLALATALMLLQPSTGRLLAVVGHWSPPPDDATALLTDGAQWSGRTDRETLRSIARTLFADASDAFLDNGASPNAFPLAVDRETPDFREGTLRVQFKLLSGPTDQSAGIVFDLKPTGEYRFVRYNTKDGNLALWGYSDGERQVIAKGDGLKQLPLGAWHELVVHIRGTQIDATVTGHPELKARFDLDRAVAGRVGVWAKRDVVTGFRRFSTAVLEP